MIHQKMINLFGDEIIVSISEAKRKQTVRKGYAAQPGTGPEGESCKTCLHDVNCGNYGGKRFHKCDLMRAHWTSGYGTDILAKSPACRRWEQKA